MVWNVSDMKFVSGKWIITKPNSKKHYATAYYRPDFFAGTKLENQFTKYPYSLEIKGLGMVECVDKYEVIHYLNKYI